MYLLSDLGGRCCQKMKGIQRISIQVYTTFRSMVQVMTGVYWNSSNDTKKLGVKFYLWRAFLF